MTVDLAAHGALCAYDWPGNIRELANVLECAQILAEGDTITPDDLPENLGRVGKSALTAGEPVPDVGPDDLDRVERRHVADATRARRILRW